MAPNGNGGVYMSLRDEGILSMLQKEGVQSIFQFGVDNILCHVADPTFLGFCASKGADCASKTVPKAHAHEPVGVIALAGGKPAVVEYSEISNEMAEANGHAEVAPLLEGLLSAEEKAEWEITKPMIKQEGLDRRLHAVFSEIGSPQDFFCHAFDKGIGRRYRRLDVCHLDKDRVVNGNGISVFRSHVMLKIQIYRVVPGINSRPAGKAVSPPGKNIDAVKFDRRVMAQIIDGSGRRHVGKNQVVVIMDA